MSPIRTGVRLRSARPGRSRPLPPLPGAVVAACLALASAAACAGGAAGPGAPGPAGPEAGQARDAGPPGPGGEYARRVAPFSVLDSAGRPYDHPFLGGLNVPRPQLVDIDGDGDADLFVQELTGQVAFFERVDSAGGTYAWRTDAWRDLPVGEWYRFADMDGDGDFDLLAEEPYSYIRLYRNVGSAEEPRFELAADSLKDVSGEPIFSDRQNIPNVADIDCDGRLDLLIGRLTGTITRYEEAGSTEGVDGRPVPTFEKVTDRFEGIEIIGQMQMAPGGNVPGANVPGAGAPPGPPPEGADEPPPGGPPPGPAALLPAREAGAAGGRPTMHGANTLILVDVDGDGDQDLLWGDFFEPGLLLIENTGGCENPDLRSTPRPWPVEDPLATSGYNAPAFGDVDGDGEPDVLVGVLGGAFNPIRTSAANLYRLDGDGEGWKLTTRRFLSQVDVGTESVPAFGDVDGDGDMDLLLGNKIEPDEPATSRIRYYENTGTDRDPELRLRGSLPIEGTYHYAPAVADLDGDGRPDLVLGTWRDRVELHLSRTETGGAATSPPSFMLADSALVRITRGSNTTPTLGDLDGDGDLDLLVGESSGTLNFYRNEGGPREPRFELVSDEFGGIDVGRRSVPVLVDLDGDGDLDLVVGSEGGELAWFQNEGTPEEPRFVRAGAVPVPAQGYAAPSFVDLDGDGDLDVVVGTAGGGLLYFEREGG